MFSPALKVPFLYDDADIIQRAHTFDRVQYLADLVGPGYFDRFAERTYRPVATFSLFIDHYLWPDDPRGYHAFNVFLHAITAVLIFLLLSRSGVSLFGAFLGGGLFALHPVTTEAVALASNREELLCGLFFFAAFALHARGGGAARAAAWLCFLLAMFSKEMAASLPLALVAWDVYVRDRDRPVLKSFLCRLPEYVPYLLIVAAFLLLRYTLMRNSVGETGWIGGSGWTTFLTMSGVFIKYLKLLFFPLRLCADYVTSEITSIASPVAALSVAGLAAYLFLAGSLRRNAPWAGFALAFFLVTLLPVSNIIPFGETMAERYLYIPLFGFAFGLAHLFDNLPRRRVGYACGGVILAALAILTPMRLAAWQSDLSLWKDTAACAPFSAEARMNLANAYVKRGDLSNALEQYALVPGCKPGGDLYKYHYNVGLAYERIGDGGSAIEAFARATRLNPRFPEAFYHLGNALGRGGEFEKGLEQMQLAIKADDKRALSYYIAGQYVSRYYENSDQLDEAIEWLERACALDPASSIYAGALGQAFIKTGRMKRARRALLRSVRLDPANEASRYLLSGLRARSGARGKSKEANKTMDDSAGDVAE